MKMSQKDARAFVVSAPIIAAGLADVFVFTNGIEKISGSATEVLAPAAATICTICQIVAPLLLLASIVIWVKSWSTTPKKQPASDLAAKERQSQIKPKTPEEAVKAFMETPGERVVTYINLANLFNHEVRTAAEHAYRKWLLTLEGMAYTEEKRKYQLEHNRLCERRRKNALYFLIASVLLHIPAIYSVVVNMPK